MTEPKIDRENFKQTIGDATGADGATLDAMVHYTLAIYTNSDGARDVLALNQQAKKQKESHSSHLHEENIEKIIKENLSNPKFKAAYDAHVKEAGSLDLAQELAFVNMLSTGKDADLQKLANESLQKIAKEQQNNQPRSLSDKLALQAAGNASNEEFIPAGAVQQTIGGVFKGLFSDPLSLITNPGGIGNGLWDALKSAALGLITQIKPVRDKIATASTMVRNGFQGQGWEWGKASEDVKIQNYARRMVEELGLEDKEGKHAAHLAGLIAAKRDAINTGPTPPAGSPAPAPGTTAGFGAPSAADPAQLQAALNNGAPNQLPGYPGVPPAGGFGPVAPVESASVKR